MHSLSSDVASVDQLVAQGIGLLKNGEPAQARMYLSEALHSTPQHDTAWLWLASAVTTHAERRYCLEQALAADTENVAARRALATIPARFASAPPIEFRAESHTQSVPQMSFMAQAASEPRLTSITAPPILAADPLLTLLPSRFSASEQRAEAAEASVVAALPADAAPGIKPQQPLIETQPRQNDLRFVLDGFSKHLNDEQICRLLCEQRGYTWQEAEAFVLRVQGEYGGAIARRQLPWFLILGVITFIGGCFLVISMADYMYYHIVAHAIFNPRVFLAFGTGILMVFGSLFGVGQCIKAALRT